MSPKKHIFSQQIQRIAAIATFYNYIHLHDTYTIPLPATCYPPSVQQERERKENNLGLWFLQFSNYTVLEHYLHLGMAYNPQPPQHHTLPHPWSTSKNCLNSYQAHPGQKPVGCPLVRPCVCVCEPVELAEKTTVFSSRSGTFIYIYRRREGGGMDVWGLGRRDTRKRGEGRLLVSRSQSLGVFFLRTDGERKF